ncbi:MAG TPA: vitamin K epoxide reductase family protein [Mucilaginibacter sp.]
MKFDLSRILEPKPNGPEVAIMLADLLGVKITKSTLSKEIEQHPDYPSLLSISDVLNGFGIENIGIKFDTLKISELPMPFITQVMGKKTGILFFTIVKDVGEKYVEYYDPEKHDWTKSTKEEFWDNGTNVALLLEAEEGAGEKDYLKNRTGEKQRTFQNYLIALSLPVITIAAGIIALAQYGAAAWLPFIYIFLTLIGAVTTTLLLWYELDQHNPVLQQICSAGKKVNCGAVLHSKASKIGGISFSAIGFSYFTGMLLFLIFSGITNVGAQFATAWINAIAVPYVLFSVYYQWRVVRQWCVMCLCVGCMLVLQLATAGFGHWHSLMSVDHVSADLITAILIAFIVPLIISILLIPALQKAKEGTRIFVDLQKLKHNKQVFEALLQKQKKIVESPKGLGIYVGDHNAAFKLIKVCNPYCGPCSRAHTPMEELLHNNPDVQIQLIFTASSREGDVGGPPVRHLLAIAEKHDEPTLKQALDDWYLAEKKNYQQFAAKYPMNGELKRQDTKIDIMKEWCKKTEVEFTPTFFVSMPAEDGSAEYFQLPKFYSVKDLKYFFSV